MSGQETACSLLQWFDITFLEWIQSRPIKMRTPILYLANRWTKFKMLLTSNRFLYLIRFLLLSFPLIPQFIAQFRSICLFLCSSPYFLPVATKWELEQSMHCPFMPLLPLFSFLSFWKNKMVEQKGPQILELEGLRGFRASGDKIGSYFHWKISFFC